MAQLELDGVVTKNVGLLRNCDGLRTWLPELAKRIGMTPVGDVVIQPYSHWPGTAPSAVLFIEESALVMHGYPERNYIELTLHSCNTISDHKKIREELVEALGLDVRFSRYTPRRNWKERSLPKVGLPQRWLVRFKDSLKILSLRFGRE